MMRGLSDGAKTRGVGRRSWARSFARCGSVVPLVAMIAAGCATQEDGITPVGGESGNSGMQTGGGAGSGSGGSSAGTNASNAGTATGGTATAGTTGSAGTSPMSGGAGMSATAGAGGTSAGTNSGGAGGTSAGAGGTSAGAGAGGKGGAGGSAGTGGKGGSAGMSGMSGMSGSAGSGGTAPVDPCANNKKDANETGTDCGGNVCAARCPTGQGCALIADCVAADVCDASKCRARGCNATNCAYDLTRFIIGTPNAGSARGQIFVTWDATNLNLDFQILDKTPLNDSVNNWEDDSVEVYLDLNHAKATTYDGDDFQINVPREGGLMGIGNVNLGSITVARTENANGYELKVTVPWAALNGAGSQVGKTIGFDVGLNDDATGDTRDTQVMLFGSDMNYLNTSQFGDLVLK
jgi:hypothetical protein